VVIIYVEPEAIAGKTKMKVYLNRNGRRKNIVRYIIQYKNRPMYNAV